MLEARLGSSIALGCSTAWAGRDAMAKCLHCVRTACALRAHCVHSAHAEARILTQEYHSSVQ